MGNGRIKREVGSRDGRHPSPAAGRNVPHDTAPADRPFANLENKGAMAAVLDESVPKRFHTGSPESGRALPRPT
jgi:hypothetical protein